MIYTSNKLGVILFTLILKHFSKYVFRTRARLMALRRRPETNMSSQSVPGEIREALSSDPAPSTASPACTASPENPIKPYSPRSTSPSSGSQGEYSIAVNPAFHNNPLVAAAGIPGSKRNYFNPLAGTSSVLALPFGLGPIRTRSLGQTSDENRTGNPTGNPSAARDRRVSELRREGSSSPGGSRSPGGSGLGSRSPGGPVVGSPHQRTAKVSLEIVQL